MSKQSLAQLRKELREALPKVGKMDRDSVVAHLAKLGKPEKKEEVAVVEKKVEKKVEKVISPSEKKKPSAEVAAPAKAARPAKGSPEMKEKMAKLREARLAKKSST